MARQESQYLTAYIFLGMVVEKGHVMDWTEFMRFILAAAGGSVATWMVMFTWYHRHDGLIISTVGESYPFMPDVPVKEIEVYCTGSSSFIDSSGFKRFYICKGSLPCAEHSGELLITIVE